VNALLPLCSQEGCLRGEDFLLKVALLYDATHHCNFTKQKN